MTAAVIVCAAPEPLAIEKPVGTVLPIKPCSVVPASNVKVMSMVLAPLVPEELTAELHNRRLYRW